MADLKKRFPIYSHLLILYPRAYRRAYEEQTLQTLADMLGDAPDKTAKISIWLRVARDFPLSLLEQQIRYTGEAMMSQTPRYIKRNALMGGLLLAPFMFALVANALDKFIAGKTLYDSWMWQMPILAIWVLYMPLLAAIIGIASWAAFLWQRARQERRGWVTAIIDIRANWPLMLLTLMGLGILAIVFGHDSVHCVTGNPVREAQYWHETWRCIQQR